MSDSSLFFLFNNSRLGCGLLSSPLLGVLVTDRGRFKIILFRATKIQLWFLVAFGNCLVSCLGFEVSVVDALESGSSELTTLALCTLELRTEHVALSSLQNAVIDQVVINTLLTLIQIMQGLVARTTSCQGFTVRVGNGQTGRQFLLRSTRYRGEIGVVSEIASTVSMEIR
jgi:hypothetical protein